MKTFKINFKEISKYLYLRTDFKFLKYKENIPKTHFLKLGNIFNLSRGIIINKEYIIENSGIYPVYSSQTENDGIFGCIDTYMFDGEYLTWTTDGYAGNVFYRKGIYKFHFAVML